MSPQQKLPISEARALAHDIATAVGESILGKSAQIRLAVACLLARGHLLIEDVPGVGKTTLAHALADACGLAWRRVQFTSDLLPADLVGVSVWESANAQFAFRPGPVFSEVLLADEVNRASPKTQSALLEAMEERRVSVDGTTHPLPDPFFVIATQNPAHHAGTFELPESQLDRFLMRLSLGYPPADAELALLSGRDRRNRSAIARVTDRDRLTALQASCADVFVGEPIARYVLRLLSATRSHPAIALGLSPRAGLALLAAARAYALTEGRDFVAPEDVQAVWHAVAAHRLHTADGRHLPDSMVADFLQGTPVA
ncbi:AAA family ATPase [Niveibacterium sp.]|uniref:AAA family ATPase n=1 Tax=Niveibacterium sp. TaxID=2017444 RepID=UPI0035B18D63